jgi:hypothetical protein
MACLSLAGGCGARGGLRRAGGGVASGRWRSGCWRVPGSGGLIGGGYRWGVGEGHMWIGTGAPGDEGNERFSPYPYLPTWQSRLACLAYHNPAKPMEIASDCDSSFSPRPRGSVSHPGLLGRLGRGGGNVCLPPSLVNGPGDSGRPVVAQIRGPHSGGLPWCRACVGALGAASSGASPLPPLRRVFAGSVFSRWGESCHVWTILGTSAQQALKALGTIVQQAHWREKS